MGQRDAGRLVVVFGLLAAMVAVGHPSLARAQTTTEAEPTPMRCLVGTAWNDENGDGIRQEDEPPLPGLEVRLSAVQTSPRSGHFSAVTDHRGRYAFVDLFPGTYSVEPLYWLPSPNSQLAPLGQGGDPSRDSDIDPATGRSSEIVLDDATPAATVDIGVGNLAPPPPTLAPIGGRVWLDANGDGLAGPCELGLADATVHLLDGTGERILTSPGPSFFFEPLPPPPLFLEVELPSGLEPSIQGAGADPTIDSDLDPATSTIGPITPGSDPADQSLDIGVLAPQGWLAGYGLATDWSGLVLTSEVEIANPSGIDLTDIELTIPGYPECDRTIARLQAGDVTRVACETDLKASGDSDGLPDAFEVRVNEQSFTFGFWFAAVYSPTPAPVEPGAPTTVAPTTTIAPQPTTTAASSTTTTSTTTTTTDPTTPTTPTSTPDVTPPTTSPPTAGSAAQVLRDSLTNGVVRVENDRCVTDIDQDSSRTGRPAFAVRCEALVEGNEFALRFAVLRNTELAAEARSGTTDGSPTERDVDNPDVALRTAYRMRATLSFPDEVELRAADGTSATGQLVVEKDILPEEGYSFDFFVRPRQVGELSGLLTLEALGEESAAIEVAAATVRLDVQSSSEPISLLVPGIVGLGFLVAVGGLFLLFANRRDRATEAELANAAAPASSRPRPATTPASETAAIATAVTGPTAPIAAAPDRSVFLSYSRRDMAVVDKVEEALERSGIPVWLDRSDITGGDVWKAKIVAGIKASSAVVLFLSRHSVESGNVATELGLGRRHDKPVLPVLLEEGLELDDQFAYDLEGVHYIELFDDSDASVARLVEVVMRFFERNETT